MDSVYGRELPRWADWALPAAGVALLLAAWHALAAWVVADATLLPAPMQMFANLWNWVAGGGFLPHLLATLTGTLLGLAIGASLGFCAGVVVGEVRALDRSLYPMVLALQAMPVVAIAPLVIVWFGIGLASKVALVAIGTFFVMFIHTVSGMHAAGSELIDMCRAFGGTRWRIVVAVKVRLALNYVFSGLEVCAALGFILCVVGEFIAADNGLGYYIKAASSNIDAAGMFAAVAVLAALASLLAGLVRLAHRYVVFWQFRKN